MTIESYQDWLFKFGQEDCCGCLFNNAVKSHCSYKGNDHCYRYHLYKESEFTDRLF